MSDMEDELRELFHRMADRVPPHGRVPKRMVRRARRRVALIAVAGVAALAAIAFGGYTGVQALNSPRAYSPGGSNPAPSQPAVGATRACGVADLTVGPDLNGAAGQLQGSLLFTNKSNVRCALWGSPVITFWDVHGKHLDVQTIPTDPWWKVDQHTPPPGWPIVTLQPGESARVRMSWGNWCGAAPAVWRVTASRDPSQYLPMRAPQPPPCLGPGQPSTLQVGQFEPNPR